MDSIKELFHQHGFTPITPLDNPANYSRDKIPAEKLGEHIARGDYGLVDKADFVLANLSPWPPHPAGKHDEVPSADVGTVAEAAYALGKGKPVFTYTNNPLPYHERVKRMHGGKPFTTDPHIAEIKRSPDGMMVDMTGGFDLLMLPAISTISGGTHTTVSNATHPYEDLSGIEQALQDVKTYFKNISPTPKHAEQPAKS
jgi:nucleoside 2-deoxyribosyltransferase